MWFPTCPALYPPLPSCPLPPPPTNCHLPPTTYLLPSATYHLLPSIYHLPPTTYHLPPTTYQLAPTTYHLPPTTYHLPPTTYQPTTYHLTPGSWFLKTLGPPTKSEILILPPAPRLLPAVSCHRLPPALRLTPPRHYIRHQRGQGGESPTRKNVVVKHSVARPRTDTFPINHFSNFSWNIGWLEISMKTFTITDICFKNGGLRCAS